MVNQTKVFSVLGLSGSGLADVSALANSFVKDSIPQGLSGFCIGQVLVTQGDSTFTRNWYTVQVDYYDPSIM